MPYILSKLANSQCYTQYVKGVNDINNVCERIFIKGGADVINKKTLDTPNGVVTEVTNEQLDILKQNADFNRHLENGFVSIIENKISEDKTEEKAAIMPKDNSRQKTPKDYKKSKGKAKPIENDNENDE